MATLQLQQTVFENIKSLCSNYNKDSIDRKDENYLIKRLTSLDDQWRDFDARHALLLEEIEDKTMKYFTDDIYGKTKNLYEQTKAKMSKLLKFLQEKKPVDFDLTGVLEEGLDSSLKTLLNRQECNFKALDRTLSKVDLNTLREKWELEDHLSAMKSKWETIDKQHWELEAILKGSNEAYTTAFVEIEHKYDSMKKILNSKLWSTVHYQQSAPRIEVPEFSGNYIQWISFKDLFMETIHNNPMINKAQKMQHLKTRLRGEAERLVQHLNISAENYNSCWEILSQRYDNRRLQFTSFVNTMLNLPVIQNPDSFNLKKMHDVITECLNGLTNIDLDITTWDPIIVHLMCQKLDSSTYTDYMKELQDHRELPKLGDFLYFLESKFMAYESIKNSKKDVQTVNKHNNNNSKSSNKTDNSKKTSYVDYKRNPSKSYHTTFGNCPYCDEKHVLMNCAKFNAMSIGERKSTVSKLQLCKNCLYSHGDKECASNKTCRECNMKHHTLLHYSVPKTMSSTTNKGKSDNNTQKSSNHLSKNDIEILLTTVQLEVQKCDGTYVTLRALLDQGSQVNLITENAAQLLRLPRSKTNASISGVGSISGDCKGRLQLTCKSIHSNYSFVTHVLVMRKLTNNLPNSTFTKRNWSHLENLKLADPDYNVSRPVDILLGADVYSDIILDGILRGGQQSPIAQQTQLGWVLCGKLNTLNCHVALINLADIAKFWEHEDIAQGQQEISKDDECEAHYAKTVRRDPNGKYIVKMPLCQNFEEKLGKSKSIATSQFIQLERRLEKNNKLSLMYREFIREYADLGHMTPVLSIPRAVPECFLPHHGVLRDHSTTTKLRVVFNASQKTSSGYSLNSLLEKGPNLQKDIQSHILKWRGYRYAFTADIEKMYRCIRVSEDQQALQKIIWRDTKNDKLQEYQLTTVTYGTKSAPWLAMRTLRQLAIDDGHKYPMAADALQNEFYVDDLISGHNELCEAKSLQTSLINLLQGGSMNLRKWSTNHPALLENLSQDQISTKNIFDFKNEENMKTLGLGWNPGTDTFTFSWNLPGRSKSQISKRNLLSDISKLYDPLGWLSPITVAVKLLFQRVWTCKLAWDETLPEDIQKEWLKFKTDIPEIKNIKLNRWIGGINQTIQLLGFCDASEKAYACVIYSRVFDECGKPTITLLAAKTRVAPLAQKTTLPRLELCGALLLSQLVEKTKNALVDYKITVQAWCDSQVVLAWLQGETSRWERFVANRVVKIKQTIPACQWRYVKSEHNPADCASRGLHPSKLVNFDLWWQGPPFLQNLRDEQQEVPSNLSCFTTNIESVNPIDGDLPSGKNKLHIVHDLLNKHSSLFRVTRVIAWILRFGASARNISEYDTIYLTTTELTRANERIIKYVQETEFAQEYDLLTKQTLVNNKSRIYKLNPYLDNKGIMRVGGRLSNSNLPLGMKHPIILSRTGRYTKLLILQAHISTLHGGARLTLAYIRQRYWILGGNREVKAQLRHCVRCHRFKPSNNYQLMGELPQQRTNPSRPFTHTGVDFTGYVDVKINKGRGVKTSKGYIAIFVCMATKAVHIELVSDLSTEAFIAALQRLCARRGTPKHMYSDCGTNFIGASKVLRKEFIQFKQILSSEFFDEIGKMEIEWHFNAPAWPTAGGLWEAAVKSMKYHLRRVLGDQKLTFEEFTTLLTKIEACMNSRPLCPLTEDPEEFYNYLTPGHFLTGSPTTSLPLSDSSDVRNIDIRRRWQLTEHLHQYFWKNWSNEYLTQLQARSKWNQPKKNITEGDIVLIKDNNLPPGKWAMGRVQELHPGADGLVRVTTLKTQTGTIKRPIVKLSPLPLDTDPEKNTTDTSNSNNLHNMPPISKRTRSKRNCLITLFTLATTIFMFISGAHALSQTTSTQITRIEPERPIYYDTMGKIQVIHDEWILLMYYNLTTYWDGVRRIKTYLNEINGFCKKTDPRYCQTTIGQLYHELDLLTYYNTILLAPHKHLSNRKRRGLVNGIGYVANSLFGILDQQFADKYENDIQAIQNNENYLLDMMKNQTSIVELQNNVLKKSEDNIRRQFNLVENFMNQTDTNFAKVESEMEAMMATNYFNSASLATYLLINNLKVVQEMLFDTLTDIYKGHIDVHLLSPVDLVKQMSEITGKLPRTLSLPLGTDKQDIKNIYKLLYVKARVTENYFLFEVHVPLTSNEDFMFYRAIPLPFRTTNGMAIMQLSSKYVAVNFKKNTYVTLTEDNMKLCTQLYTDSLICNENLPVYNLHNNNAPCEAKLLAHGSNLPCDTRRASCKDAWLELHAPNTWLAICCSTCVLRTICENEVTTHTLTSSAILTLAEGCLLQSKDLTIFSHNKYNTNMKIEGQFIGPSLINTSINNMVNLSYHHVLPDFTTEDKEGIEIEKRLKSLRAHENHLPSTISDHDIHQYAISYSLLGAVIVAVMLWLVKKKKITFCCCLSRKQPKPVSEDIELRPVRPLTNNFEVHEKAVSAHTSKRMRMAHPRQQEPITADNVVFSFD